MSDTQFNPPEAFYFNVAFASDVGGIANIFQEVSGFQSSIEIPSVESGGQNQFVHTPPKTQSYNLVLSRGIVSVDSPFVKWCKSTFESDVTTPIQPMSLLVCLLDASGTEMVIWSFTNAFPVELTLGQTKVNNNELIIESIELSYDTFQRLK
jgi:phage tail-like protein